MAENRTGPHPELDRLIDLTEGLLTEAEAAPLQAHLADCAHCRLELKRLAQFNNQADDAQVLDEAGWDRAELALHRAYKQKIEPTIRPSGSTRPWYVRMAPVAAAAVLLVAFLNFDQWPLRQNDPAVDGPLRGDGSTNSQIVLDCPSEEIAEAPEEFAWSSEQDFDSYILEVFSPDLEPIFRLADLRAPVAVLPDSLVLLFEPGEIYLWNVQGRTGLTDAELSLTAWFRIGPDLRP
jgi:Putative zinc-finger